MNQVFSFNRFLLLIAKHWSENSKKYLLGLLAIGGIMLVWFGFYITMEQYHPMDDSLQFSTYYVGLFIVGCLYASTLFADLSSKSKGTNYLSVPASTLEKTVCTLLYGVVIFFIAYTLVFYVADVIMVNVGNAVAKTHWQKNHAAGDVFEPQKVANVFGINNQLAHGEFNLLFYVLLCYFAVQSAFLLGSVYFTKFSFIKTTVGLIFIWLLIIVFVGKVLDSFMPAGSFYQGMTSYRLFGSGEEMSEKILRLPEWTNTVSLFLLKYAFAPIFWIATYFRVKEKEI